MNQPSESPSIRKSVQQNILICFDEALIQEACVLMTGLADCLSNVVIHCITTPSVSEISKNQMQRVATVLNVKILFYAPKVIVGRFERTDKSLIRFQKLIYNEILPRDLPNLLYLDIDTLPIRNLSDLFEIEFSEAFAAVSLEDFVSRKFERWNSVANAGVILFNHDVWRALNLNLRAREFIAQYNEDSGNLLHSDELVLNKIYYQKWLRLPSFYNCTFLQTYTSRYLFRWKDIRIVHFIGPKKIWNMTWKSIGYLRFLRIYRSRLHRYLALSQATSQHLKIH